MSRLRLPMRLARREVWRRPGRTALVAFLVALPVASMALAMTVIRTGEVTPAQEWERRYGQADAVANFDLPPPIPVGATAAADPAPELPDGSRSLAVESISFRALTSDGYRSQVDLSDLPLLDPMTAGIHDLVRGRAATAPGEVALSTSLARKLHVGVGDDVRLERPGLDWHVVGLVEPVGCLSCTHALAAPGSIPELDGFAPGRFTLIDLPPMSAAQMEQLQSSGSVEIRDVVIDAFFAYQSSNPAQGVRWSFVMGALVLTVAGIVISAAFAVGARRQLVTLGQMSASGASPATLRTALLLQGTVTGIVGAVAGLAMWLGVLVWMRPTLERLLNTRIDHFVIRVPEVAGAVAVGVLAATIAALIPARTASGIPTLAALAGRRPLTPVSRRQVTRGVFAFLAGLGLLGLAVLGSTQDGGSSGSEVWLFVAILGGVAELLGACALAPVVVARLEPLAKRLRGSWRLGARGLARHRSRTGAVVSAVSAAGALAIAASGLMQGAQAQYGDYGRLPDNVVTASEVTPPTESDAVEVTRPPGAEQRAELQQILRGSTEVTIRATTRMVTSDGFGWWEVRTPDSNALSVTGADVVVVADPAVLDLIRADSELRSALADAGIVALTHRGGELAAGPVLVRLPTGQTVDGRAVNHRYGTGAGSEILISTDRAAELGLEVEPVASAFVTPKVLSAGQRDDLEDLQLQQNPGLPGGFSMVHYDSPSSGPTPFQVELLLTGLALVFSLFVVGVSLALAAAESKDERDVLTIAGAPPAALARSAGVRAWLLAAIGGAMAIPIGFLPVVVFAKARSGAGSVDAFPIVFPSRTALLLLLAIPIVVALASLVSSAVAQRLRPVRVSTATFE